MMRISIEKYKIPKGAKLYRFIKCYYCDYNSGMTRNKKHLGRCNLNQNIYYCTRSMDALLTEMGNRLNGILVVSEVVEDIYCGCVCDIEHHKKLRGRVLGEDKTIIHKTLLKKFGYDEITNYEETNKITKEVLKKYPDGLAYSSVNSADINVCGTFFYIANSGSDYGPFENIALTEFGFNKLKQHDPIVYWHY